MRTSSILWAAAGVLWLLLLPALQAQAAPEGDAASAPATAAAEGSGAFDSLLSFPERAAPRFRYGASLTNQYVMSSSGPKDDGTDNILISPYAAVNMGRGRTSLVFSFSPAVKFEPFTSTTFHATGFLDPDLVVGVAINRRLSLDLNGGILYGNQLTVLSRQGIEGCGADCRQESEAPARLSAAAMRGVESTIVTSTSEDVFNGHAGATLIWQQSRRLQVSLSTQYAYASTSSIDSANTVAERGALRYGLTRRTALITYGEVYRLFGSREDCLGYGGGLRLEQRLTRTTTWGGGGGPEFGSSGCIQHVSAAFSGFVRHELPQQTVITIEGFRQQATPNLGADSWTNGATGQLERRIWAGFTGSLNGSYVRTDTNQRAALQYTGYSVSPHIKLVGRARWNASLAYLHFYGSITRHGVGQPDLRRDFLLLNVSWNSSPVVF